MLRLGLCCIFREEPIRFRRTTAKYLATFPRTEQLRRLGELCAHNARSLRAALAFCRDRGIMDFRINSQILPLKTHPTIGYSMEALPDFEKIIGLFKDCGRLSRAGGLRTTFHPDQFILLSARDQGIIDRSVADLAYQAEVADWVGADVINIHGGGAYGDKASSLKRLRRQIDRLPTAVRNRLTLENDDRTYTPADLLPVCRDMDLPLVYDVHHHRCLPDGFNIERTTELAMATWHREPLFHLSSPANPWGAANPKNHHDFIDAADFPACWRTLDVTVEVEAKAKELAVMKLQRDLETMPSDRLKKCTDQ